MSAGPPRPRPAPPTLHRVMVLYHPKIARTRPEAEAICQWLADQGVESYQGLTWEEAAVRPLVQQSDLVIVLGGDGSLLRAARMTAAYGIPLLGVNMGRVGFLTEMNPANWRERLPRVLAGDCWIEERMMLQAVTWRDDRLIGRYNALNDVVISRGSLARVVHLKTEIDGDTLTTYVADGLILATPTGSTAYALAVGGPILPPELHNILVLPIAPHLSLNRPVVLSEGSSVQVQVRTDHQAILTVDGQFEFKMRSGDRIIVSSSEHVSRFVRLGPHTYFYQALLARLGPRQGDTREQLT